MPTDAIVQAHVSEDVKRAAMEVLSDFGLTVSDALRLTLNQVARDKALPFALTPNDTTARTLEASERGEDLHRADNTDDLFAQMKA